MMKTVLKYLFTNYRKHKQIILSLFIFSIVFIFLGLLYKNWWFDEGSYTLLFNQGYKTQNWNIKDYFHFFYHGHTDQILGPNNTKSTSFLFTAYRPLYSIYAAIQYRLFGTNAYYYLLTNAFFHAINTVILFNIFLWFINYFLAFLISLLFAFHPLIGYRFGPIEFLHIYINLTLILLSFIFFKKYLETKKFKYNIATCLSFLISLFTREVSIVLPVIFLGGTYLYQNKNKQNFIKNFKLKIIQALKLTSGIWITAIGFLSLRTYLHPQVTSLFKQLKTRLFSFSFHEINSLITDTLGLTMIPSNYKIIKIILIIYFIILFLWLFIKNTKKVFIIFFLASATIILWPSYIRSYVPRYLYEAYPFILIAFILCFKYYKHQNINLKRLFPLLIAIVLFFTTFTIKTVHKREKIHSLKKMATQKLLKNKKIKNRNLCFLALPLHYCSGGYEELLWVLLNNTDIDISFDLFTQSNVSIKHLPRWKLPEEPYPTKNYIQITPIINGFKFTTTNPEKISFPNHTQFKLGKKFIIKQTQVKQNKVISKLKVLFNKNYLSKNPLFITWNYKKSNFKILKKYNE